MLNIETGQNVLKHPDVQKGLHQRRHEDDHKNHRVNLIKAISIGLAGTVAAAGVYIGSSRLFGPENGGDHGIAPITTSDTLNPTPTPIETELIPAVTIYNTEVSPTPTPEPTPSPTPTPEPTPTPTPALSPEQQEDLAMQEKLTLAPEIAGLAKQIKEVNGLKRVVYIAESGNRFGIEVGAYAGEYKKEVTFEDKEVGAVALITKANKVLLEEDLKSKDISLILPVDISDLKKLNEVKLTLNNIPTTGPYAIKISCDNGEEFNVINVMPTKTTLRQSVSKITGYGYTLSSLNDNSDTIIEGREMEYINIKAILDNPFGVDMKVLSFGGVLGKTNNPVYVSMDSVKDGLKREHSFKDILKINDVPVFITNNK